MPGKRHSGSDLVEHDDLVGELPLVEKMSTAERLKHAKKRRQHQLKKFSQYEKQLEKENNKKTKKGQQNKKIKRAGHNKRVHFISNVKLLEAAARNDIEEVRNLLKGKVSPDVTNEDGLTALHQCCIDDLEEMLRLLLEYGANVNAQDSELWTPLHAAATCGHIHLCKILIDHGAELLSVNADGNMPYDICEDEVTLDFIENEMAKRGVTQEQIDETRLSTEIQMLKDLKVYADEGGDLELTGRVSETPLHIAAANGYLQVAEFLISKNVSLNVRDEDSWQPIHAAACWGHLPVLEVLVQHGADLDAKTKNGETPYDICEDIEIRERLMELKSEMAAKGQIKSRNVVRRRSTKSRSPKISPRGQSHSQSSSVRRVSSKEKGAIAHKEAMEEAGRLRESVSDQEEQDEAEEHQPKQNGSSVEAPRKVEDIKVYITDTHPTPEEPPPSQLPLKPAAKPQQSKPEPKTEAFPTSRPELKPDTAKQKPEEKATKPDAKVNEKKAAPEKPSRAQQSVERGVPGKTTNIEMIEKDAQPRGTAEVLNTQSTTTKPMAVGKAKEGPQQQQPVKQQKDSTNKKSTSDATAKPLVNPAASETKSGEADSKKSLKKSAPKAPVAVAAGDNKPDPNLSQHQQQPSKGKEHAKSSGPAQGGDVHGDLNKASPHPSDKQGHTTTETNKTITKSTPGGVSVPPKHSEASHPLENSPPPQRQQQQGTPHVGSPPQGTLSDLKKQRAQKLQEKMHESLKFKDRDGLNQEVSNHNANYKSAEPMAANKPVAQAHQPPPSQQQFTNGHNGKVPASNNNAYPVRSGESVKRYKFSDTTSVLGDDDTQTSCCVVQ